MARSVWGKEREGEGPLGERLHLRSGNQGERKGKKQRKKGEIFAHCCVRSVTKEGGNRTKLRPAKKRKERTF